MLWESSKDNSSKVTPSIYARGAAWLFQWGWSRKTATNKTTTPAKPAQEKEEAKVANTKKVTTEQSSTKERATSSY